jgi:membrane-associated protease RseP (regulator of RpoE activity)
MHRLLVSALTLVLSGTAGAREAHIPRYRQVIGTQLFTSYMSPTYGCVESANSTRMYDYDPKSRGVLLLDPRAGSPAEKAGLRCRDIVIAVDGHVVRSAEEMKDMVAQASDGHVEITYLTPLHPEAIAMAVEYEKEPKRVTVETITLDEVEERKRILPVETNFNIADVFGPKFVFDTSATFTEIAPGRIRYECTLMHHGDQAVLPIESPLLPYIGLDDVLPEIPHDGTKTLRIEADVETDGIPVLTEISLGVARAISMDGDVISRFIGKHPHASVGVVKGVNSTEPNWYSWQQITIECFLPEKLSRELEYRKTRLGRAG